MQYKNFYCSLPVRANNVLMLDGVVQNDTANIVHAQLMDGETPFDFDGFTNIVLTVLTPTINPVTGENVRVVSMISSQEEFTDENPYAIHAVDPKHGRIDFALSGALTQEASEYFAQIEILDSGEVITSTKLNYRVKENLLDNAPAGSFISADQLTNLQGIFNELSTLIDSLGNWSIAEDDRESSEELRKETEIARTETFQEQSAAVANMLANIEANLTKAATEADRAFRYSTLAATPTLEMVEEALEILGMDIPTRQDIATAIAEALASRLDLGDFTEDAIVHTVRQGEAEDLPELDVGEFGFTTDEKHLYVGTDSGNEDLSRHYVVSDTQPVDTNILWIDSANSNAIKFFDETEQEWTPTATSVFA